MPDILHSQPRIEKKDFCLLDNKFFIVEIFNSRKLKLNLNFFHKKILLISNKFTLPNKLNLNMSNST